MVEGERLRWDHPAVHIHLQILQSIIQRMANNSASAKTWCITLVSAILVVTFESHQPIGVWAASIAVVVLGVVDAYYLALERSFRATYNSFLDRLHAGEATQQDLFQVKREGPLWLQTLQAIGSFSVWGVYGPLLAAVILLPFLAG